MFSFDLKLFFVKAVLFISIIIFLQWLIVDFFPHSNDEVVQQFQNMLEGKPDIIYFGDSVMRTFDQRDSDKRAVYKILEEHLPKKRIVSIDHMAYHADIYLAYVENLVKEETSYLDVVIIPINLRSFSPEWDKRPVYQFEKEKLYLRYEKTPIYPFLSFLIAIKAINTQPISDSEFLDVSVFLGDKKVGVVKDFESKSYSNFSKERFEKKITYFYMYELDVNHRKIISLSRIADLLNKKNITVVFYITPIDYQTGEVYLPDQFTRQLKKNADVIERELKKKQVSVVSMVFDLPSSSFAWETNIYVNEHLNESGRKHVAKKLGEEIKKLLK